MRMKYVIIKDFTHGEQPIIFSGTISHKIFSNFNIVSAGFIEIKEKKIKCYGISLSLDLKSRKEDVDIIKNCDIIV